MSSPIRRALAACLPFLLATAADASSSRVPKAEPIDAVPGEIVLRLRHGRGPLDERRVLGLVQARVVERATLRADEASDAPLLLLSTDRPLAEAIAELAKDPDVVLAEPNGRVRAAEEADDPFYVDGHAWGTYSDDAPAHAGPQGTTNPFGSGAEQAWAAGRVGSGQVHVAVLDEGVALEHPDLAANAWTNPFDPPNGADDDRNGKVDDVHGWDFVNDDASVYDGGATGSIDRHGTHVAGIIGAAGGNALGVAGMAWDVTIVPVKILGPQGGTAFSATKGMDYVTDLRTRHGLRLVAMNMSWTTSTHSTAMQDAAIRAAKAGILLVCAAGNAGANNDSTGVYPANFDTRQRTLTQSGATYDAVVSVAAITMDGALASYSNYGATRVDLGAPGHVIVSTLPPATFGGASGTSMAAPHVTGAVALHAALHGGATAAQVRAAILGSTVPTPSLAGRCVTGGRLDVSGPAFTGAVPVRDVAVTDVVVPASVAQGTPVTVPVTVANQGTQPETFTVTLADVPPAGGRAGAVSTPRSVTVAAGATAVTTFTWTTTQASAGVHQLRATAASVPSEIDLADNVLAASSTVTVPPTPTVTSIVPASTRRNTSISVTVMGTNFATGARLTFTGGSGPVPTAGAATVAPGGTSLTATVTVGNGFMFRPGVWDVVVTNPDTRNGRKDDAFTVNL